MAGIALVGVLLCVSARVSLPGVRGFFRAGAIGIVLGCVSEIVDLTLTRFFTPVPVVSALFDPLFYLGVLAFVIGIFRASRMTGRIRRRGEALLDDLDAVAARRGVASLPGLTDEPSTDTRLHALRVAVEDHAIATSSPLSAPERALLDDIDAHLTRRPTGARP